MTMMAVIAHEKQNLAMTDQVEIQLNLIIVKTYEEMDSTIHQIPIIEMMEIPLPETVVMNLVPLKQIQFVLEVIMQIQTHESLFEEMESFSLKETRNYFEMMITYFLEMDEMKTVKLNLDGFVREEMKLPKVIERKPLK